MRILYIWSHIVHNTITAYAMFKFRRRRCLKSTRIIYIDSLLLYRMKIGAQIKGILIILLLILIVSITIRFNGEDNILNHPITQHEAYQCKFENRSDLYCLKTLKDVIDKDKEGNFVIPARSVLLALRLNVLDCLYQRYTTSLQTYCSRQDKHGSCLSGWNLCVDGCYKPNSDTIIRVLSYREIYNDTRMHSVTSAYQSRVAYYEPELIGGRINFQHIESTQMKDQRVNFIDDVNYLKRKGDVLIIDVGNVTTQTINYIIEKGILKYFKQISFRTQYIDNTKSIIDYVSALYQLSQFYINGFRMYWYQMEWDCILKGNIYRTSCVTINLIQTKCEQKVISKIQKHLTVPDDETLSRYNLDQEALFYQRYLTSTQTLCKETIRLGGILDGGWEVCNDEKYRPNQSCLVYSFGINFDFKFDDAVVEAYGCEVHSFDPSMKTNDFQHNSHVSFHNLGLSGENIEVDVKTGWKLSTLKYIKENLGHMNRKLDIIKIDIEESEWKALPEMIQSGALRDVSQILIEFHSIGTKIHLKVLRLLYDEGFRIFWYHRNPNCCIKDKLIEYSLCNEVYFVRE